ncbi:diguanylate cyclase [Novosphingobium colocasiae]|uniref:sensor domain-containing diguanylate cyclase n=1 Tax=Novosphingobium colocasiae TaxID=1256513 RepID=UPI0035B33B00
MTNDGVLVDEPGRLAALARLAVVDTPPEEPFDNVVSLVRNILDVPIAAVSLIAEDRQWFKARSGFEATETPRSASFCSHTILKHEPLVIEDARLDVRFANSPSVLEDPFVRSYAGIPLCTPDGYNIGSLCAVDTRVRRYTENDLAILGNLARIVMNELELRRIAGRDQLTGALTRRGFIEAAEQEIVRFLRYGRPASLLLIDVDHFKSVNDTHGHPMGDKVLRHLAASISSAKRPVDVLGRLGGEEFALLLPETDVTNAGAVAERLRRTIAGDYVPIPGFGELQITASIGIAPMRTGIASAEDWIAAADAPLYAAKRAGRNRCELARAA